MPFVKCINCSDMWKFLGCVILCVTSFKMVTSKKLTPMDYCKISEYHVLCPEYETPRCCRRILEEGVGGNYVNYILHLHNMLRNKVALQQYWFVDEGTNSSLPPATNMFEMRWDDELQLFAQEWASHCYSFPAICSDTENFQVYQIFITLRNPNGSQADSWKQYMKSSTDLISKEFSNIIHSYKSNALEDISQILWHDTYLIGCGFVRSRVSKAKNITQDFLVCNYGPIGLRKDEPIYEDGSPCTDCPPEKSACKVSRPGLCSCGQCLSTHSIILSSVVVAIIFIISSI